MNYILDFKNTTTDDQISSYISENSLAVIKTYSHFDKIFLVSGNSLPPKTEILEHVVEDHDHGISLLETVNIIDFVSVTSDVNLNDEKNWWKISLFNKVDFEKESQQVKKVGSRINVYLLDSGVNLSHLDFSEGRIENLFSFNNDFSDTKGHGTALASVITGKDCGISNATVKSVKIFDVNQPTLQSDMISALDAVLVDFIANGQKQSILNLSWAIPKNEYIEAKLNYLISLGLKVLCAAGNNGVPISDVTPASMKNVIKVGAFNQNFEPCNFSNYEGGSHVSVTSNLTNHADNQHDYFGWAPGELIYAANKDGTFGYTAGTSIACAIATGVLAHNLDLFYTSDTSMYPNYYFDTYTAYESVFLRNNILNLSEKYSSTRNSITTILLDTNIGHLDDNLSEIRYINYPYNSFFKLRICDTLNYNKVTYNGLENISADLKIDNGFLYGKIPDIWNTGVKQFTLPVKLEGVDSKDVVITLTVANSLQEIRDQNIAISSVDPTLLITLYDDSCCTYSAPLCGPNGVGTACYNACGTACSQPGFFGVAFRACGFDGPVSKAGCSCQCECWVGSPPPDGDTIAATVC